MTAHAAAERYRILDVHHHVGDPTVALPLSHASGPAAEDRELAIRLETMDRNGVDAAIVIPGHSYLRPEGLADTRRINDGIAAYRDAHPDRFAGALGIVEPLYGRAGDTELRRIKDELGLLGVSTHTRFQGVATDSPLVTAQVAVMAELGLVPFLHCVAEATEEALWRVQAVARAFPDVPIVVLDCFSSYDQGTQAMHVADACPNLIFDTSLAYTIEPALRLIERPGHHRLIFGTDLYSHPLGYRRNYVLTQLLEAELAPNVLQDVLAGNAERLLGLARKDP
jgi:predicted TIM-barrel fold metal-dependent hydrolase